jgi:hypothetical protein
LQAVIGDAIYTLLNVADITDVVTGGIHHTVAPQDTPNPCLVINERGVNENYKNNSQIINHSLTIDVYCDKGKNGAGGFALANEIAILVNSKINRFSGIVGTKQIDTIYKVGSDALYDSISESARLILEYNVRENEEGGLADPLTYPLDIDIFEDDVFSRTESVSGFTGTLDLRLFANLKAIVTGQEVIIQSVFLLANFINARAAYSLRKLNVCSTKAIRVRRSTDDTELDIGFSGNDLDMATLEDFSDGGDCFVSVFYDQQNSNDLSQSTEAQQPHIVSLGSVITDNGKPAINFDGTTSLYRDGFSVDVSTDYSNFAVCNLDDVTTSFLLSSIKNSSNRYALGINSDGDFQTTKRTTSIVADAATYKSGQVLLSDDETPNIYLDGTLGSAVNGTLNNANTSERFVLGKNTPLSTGNNIVGTVQEVIVYGNSDDRLGIESNIKDYYGIS